VACDGSHSAYRQNLARRQEVGGSAIEASKIAGHSSVEMTGEYTFVGIPRQDELTRAIQEKLARAAKKNGKAAQEASGLDDPAAPAGARSLADAGAATTVVQ
jgi:hypothetical protein